MFFKVFLHKKLEDQSNKMSPFEKSFAKEVLKSEVLRVTILAGFFMLAFIWFLIISNVDPAAFMRTRHPGFYKLLLGLLFIFMVYEIGARVAFSHLLKNHEMFLPLPRYVNAFVETSMPTLVIILFSRTEQINALFMPMCLAYFIFIGLSALRLDYKQCLFTGAVASFEYLAVAVWLIDKHPGSSAPILELGIIHFARAFIIFSFGIAISFVSIELKKRFMTSYKSLKEYSTKIEQEVKERTSDLNLTLIEKELANKKVIDSINYSRLIQRSLLPDKNEVKASIPNSTLLWMPKDIVGGDITFYEKIGDGIVYAVLDCTGHGVPGAFMTMLAVSCLNRIVNDDLCSEPNDPASILKQLNFMIKRTLKQDKENPLSNDGLDAGICFIPNSGGTIIYSGARLGLFHVNDGVVEMVRGDKQSIGYIDSDTDFIFTNKKVPFKPDTMFYLSTDGFTDQLGGKKGFSFGKKRFKALLSQIYSMPLEEQQEALMDAFNAYRGGNERQDDVTVACFKVPSVFL